VSNATSKKDKKNKGHTEESEKSFQHNLDNLNNMLKRFEKISEVSPTFCTAKWLQSTVYLHTGLTHSCHHPPAHKIPLDEIENSPAALHNTKYKKEQRQKMLEGERPNECHYCWNIEDLPSENMSDRMFKSTNTQWSFQHLEKIKSAGSKSDLNPTYLEVAFDNTCNFKCMYCSPDISTTWMDEILQNGPYPTSVKTGNLDWLKEQDRLPIRHDQHNPYVEAFWKWWPQLYKDLNTFRITGGEPLLNQNTWKVLEFVNNNPHSEFNLAINTNMGIQSKWITKFCQVSNSIADRINSLDIYTSCEAQGEQAEYIRFGLNYKSFMDNNEYLLSNAYEQNRLHFMITFNALSITSFLSFLADIRKLRRKFKPYKMLDRVSLMVSYLQWPQFQSVLVLPKEIRQSYSAQFLNYAQENSIESGPDGFLYLEEVEQIKRLSQFMLQELDENDLYLRRKDFGLFYQEYDKRKKTNFSKVFPELSEFYGKCLKL